MFLIRKVLKITGMETKICQYWNKKVKCVLEAYENTKKICIKYFTFYYYLFCYTELKNTFEWKRLKFYDENHLFLERLKKQQSTNSNLI